MRQLLPPIHRFLVILAGFITLSAFQLQDPPVLSRLSTLVQPLDLQSDALNILKAKCNVCHEKRNPGKVFTRDNMTRFAPKIYRQVFVTKRMPKGRDNTLSYSERTALKKWLDTQSIKKS